MHKKYADKGLVVLGFPSDQFGSQNPEDDAGTAEFCVRNHGVTFPLLKKGDVNGDKTHPVFKLLKSEAKGLLGERVRPVRSSSVSSMSSLTVSCSRSRGTSRYDTLPVASARDLALTLLFC